MKPSAREGCAGKLAAPRVATEHLNGLPFFLFGSKKAPSGDSDQQQTAGPWQPLLTKSVLATVLLALVVGGSTLGSSILGGSSRSGPTFTPEGTSTTFASSTGNAPAPSCVGQGHIGGGGTRQMVVLAVRFECSDPLAAFVIAVPGYMLRALDLSMRGTCSRVSAFSFRCAPSTPVGSDTAVTLSLGVSATPRRVAFTVDAVFVGGGRLFLPLHT